MMAALVVVDTVLKLCMYVDYSVRVMWEWKRHHAHCGRFSCSTRYVWEDTVESGSWATVDTVGKKE